MGIQIPSASQPPVVGYVVSESALSGNAVQRPTLGTFVISLVPTAKAAEFVQYVPLSLERIYHGSMESGGQLTCFLGGAKGRFDPISSCIN